MPIERRLADTCALSHAIQRYVSTVPGQQLRERLHDRSTIALGVARGHNLDASDSRITSRVGLGPTGRGGFTLSVSLDLHAPQLSAEQAADLMARAHERCPYSNATRGNIDVQLTVDGQPLEVMSHTS